MEGLKFVDRIKLIVSDCDGVITDGKKFYTPNGVVGKFFFERDWTAQKQFKASGVSFVFITSDQMNIDLMRVKSKHIVVHYVHRDKKFDGLKFLMRQYGVGPNETAYVGDDIEDTPALLYLKNNGGMAFVPKNAHPSLLKKFTVINRNGGEGVLEQLYEELFGD